MEYMSREDYCEEYCGKENRKGYKTCHNCAMLNVPSVDVKPIRRGRWVRIIGDDYECSKCKAALWSKGVNPMGKYKFCWSCGEKMDMPEAIKG